MIQPADFLSISLENRHIIHTSEALSQQTITYMMDKARRTHFDHGIIILAPQKNVMILSKNCLPSQPILCIVHEHSNPLSIIEDTSHAYPIYWWVHQSSIKHTMTYGSTQQTALDTSYTTRHTFWLTHSHLTQTTYSYTSLEQNITVHLHDHSSHQHNAYTLPHPHTPMNFVWNNHHMPHSHNTRSTHYARCLINSKCNIKVSSLVDAKKDAKNVYANQKIFGVHAEQKESSGSFEGRPDMRISTDSIECTHACASFHIPYETMIYLVSKGMSPLEARRLWLYHWMSKGTPEDFQRSVQDYVQRLYQRS